MVFTPILLCVLICIHVAICETKICDIKDSKCLTEASNLAFSAFVSGTSGVDFSDPLHLDLIEANLPTIKYKFMNCSLSGMKTCRTELVEIVPSEMKYKYYIGCPHLTLDAEYEMEGYVGAQFLEGKGTCRNDFYDYHYHFNGDYEKKIAADGKIYINMKNYNLDIEAKGRVEFNYKQLFNGDKEKSDAAHKYANENWEFADKLVRKPTMEAFMKKYIEKVQAYLNLVPLEDLFRFS